MGGTTQVISVLTTPRRGQYLAQTLAALDAAGAHRFKRWVFVDGDCSVVSAPGWAVTEVKGGTGTIAAIISVLLSASRIGEDLLYFEDDVLPCRHAVSALWALRVPEDCAFLVACDTAGQSGSARQIVKIDDTHGRPWGNQALKIPARTLRLFADTWKDVARPVDKFTADGWFRQVVCGGRQMGQKPGWGNTTPWKYYGVICPSLFDHVGEVSAVNPEWKLTDGLGFRKPKNWQGVDWDAMQILDAGYFVG